jgi:protein-tyrosine phosphatase
MRVGRVLPNLVVGPDPWDVEAFRQLIAEHVTAILNLQTDEDLEKRGTVWEENLVRLAGVDICRVPVRDFDEADLQRRLPRCVAELDRLLKARHTVYVHCSAGVSRSPTVVAAYLHRHSGMLLEEALASVQAVRYCSPNADVIRNARWPDRLPETAADETREG